MVNGCFHPAQSFKGSRQKSAVSLNRVPTEAARAPASGRLPTKGSQNCLLSTCRSEHVRLPAARAKQTAELSSVFMDSGQGVHVAGLTARKHRNLRLNSPACG